MKILLFLIAVFVLLWLLRGSLRPSTAPVRTAQDRAETVRCRCWPVPSAESTCRVNEALPGRGGVFCGEAHRAAFERAHPE